MMKHKLGVYLMLLFAGLANAADETPRNAYFGDLHIHTRYSFDAFLFGTKTTPDDAYAFARGEAIQHPAGFEIQLARPLDFYAVTDHAMFLGMWSAMEQPTHPLHNDPLVQAFLNAKTVAERTQSFLGMRFLMNPSADERSLADHVATDLTDSKSAWSEIQASANRNYEPGKLTTFIAYEYTSSRDGNLHRNVIYRGDAAPNMPYSRLDSLNPEDLWTWMDSQREQGFEALAIPHNTNQSNGNEFQMTRFDGSAMDADYAIQRMRNEPLVEITQIKGTSDTHPFLSPNDEWADFEIFPYQIASWNKSWPRGSYVREAWLNGFKLEQDLGENPYRFGVIGASDTHNSGDVFDESNFVSKVGMLDSDPVNRGSVPSAHRDGLPAFREVPNRFFGSSGIAGVWAGENTRESIYDAFRRKETFATTGSRIKVRLFASYDYDDALLDAPDLVASAYANGVSMGAELLAKRRGEPRFLAWASRDPMRAELQRLQIIKGWLDAGQTQEAVYDVACAGGAAVDPETHRCPDNGATVDLTDCSVTADVGAAELLTLWDDPDFDPKQRAFYYVRVLENPTCRWSTWDAIRAGTAPRPDLATTIQERAWSSPIWIVPR
ncbi:MAG: DUF3604 domain-containing protein [Pseudomonadales bacterium]|nr:DUF3604 domain-containing protein [Pseudomonadales bacterium]